MEELVPVQHFEAAYTLGKIHSKHLILEILSFSNRSNYLIKLMFRSNWNLRMLLIQNYRLFKKIIVQIESPITSYFDHTAAQHFGVTFKMGKKFK